MVKLTPELIDNSRQFINPVRDRELDLRGKFLVTFLLKWENFSFVFRL